MMKIRRMILMIKMVMKRIMLIVSRVIDGFLLFVVVDINVRIIMVVDVML